MLEHSHVSHLTLPVNQRAVQDVVCALHYLCVVSQLQEEMQKLLLGTNLKNRS